MKKSKPIKKPIKVTHNAPKKKGKQEIRQFRTLEQALEYVDKNIKGRLKQ